MTFETKPRNFKMPEGLWLCFFSVPYYRHVLNVWKGFAFRFLLLVSIVFSVLTITGIYLRVMTILQSPEAETVMQSIPMLQLKNGEMSTTEGKVERILHPTELNKIVIVVDPKDTFPKIEDAHAPVLLQSKNFTVQMPGRNAIKLKYSTLLRDSVISGIAILTQLKELANATVLPVAVVTIILSFAITFSKSLLLALLLRVFGLSHTYSATVRILIVAFTPSLLLSGLAILLNIQLGAWDMHVFNIISLLYIIFAFRACRKKSEPVPSTQ